MFNKIAVHLNRTTRTAEWLGTVHTRGYRFGDQLEQLPTTYNIEAGTPTRAAEGILKIATMEGLHDADGNTWPEDERKLEIGDVLVITNDDDQTTIYARSRYAWTPLSENQLPYPEPVD